MAQKSIAERVYTAYLTGGEADFYAGGTTYTFTPEGLKAYIMSDVNIPTVPQADAVDDATDGNDIVAQFNALLTSLRGAGLLAESE